MKGSLIKRGKTSWRYRFDGPPFPTGERNQINGTIKAKTKSDAETELRRIMAEHDGGSLIEPSRITVAEYLGEWLRHVGAKLASTTVERYAQACNKHIVPELGCIRLQKLQPMEIQRFLDKKKVDGRLDGNGGLDARTVLHIHRILKRALAQAVGWRYLKANPMTGVEAPKPQKARIEFLDKTETAKRLKAAQTRVIDPIILLAVTTGMRRGEILGLSWSDIDFDKSGGPSLTVRQALVETSEKGLEYKKPKSEAGERVITLPNITVQELRRHRARQSEYFLKLGVRVGNDGPVFATLKDDDTIGPMTPRSLTKSFTRLIKDVDIPQITLHGLRHSHITHLLMDNAPIKLVSARAGHSTVAITLDVYGHVLPDKQQEVADSYGDALSLALAEQDRNG